MNPDDLPDAVASAFDVPDPLVRAGMLALRALVFEVASQVPQIGPIEEALRWGQPTFLTPGKKAGTSLRIAPHKAARFALLVHCQTTIIPEFQEIFPGQGRTDGTRAVLFDSVSQIDPVRHGWLIRRALTYHLARSS